MEIIRSLRRVLGALALVAASVVADPLAAQEGRVLGRVTDGVGNPIPGAQITLVPDGGAPPLRAVAGLTGGFEFAGVAAGTYTLRAERPGFPVFERRITVREGEIVSQVLRLRSARGRQVALATP